MSAPAPHGLALDHLTAADATPSQLVETAAAAGARAVCIFLRSMEVLPRLPQYDLCRDGPERRAAKARLDGLGIGLDLVYPFTLASRTEVTAFAPALETAAWLGARLVNVLVYDREPQRRAERFAQFCELATPYGLQVAVEFYPSSQIRTLAEALELAAQAGRRGQVGVNVDLLHLVRSGGRAAEVAAAPPGLILYGQFCDGAADCEPARREFEASQQRRLAGEGVFDIAAFAAALPPGVPTSVELPQDAALAAGRSRLERARAALDGVAARLGRPMRGGVAECAE